MESSNRVKASQNRFQDSAGVAALSPAEIRTVRSFHRSLPGYAPTPLYALPVLAERLGVERILIKDESQRFGLNAFKVLGASYGLARFLDSRKPGEGLITLATATDGNHGRAVAWAARRLGHRAVVFVPEDMALARRQAIQSEGAEVRVVAGNYDQAVAEADRVSRKNGWSLLSDTAYPGYEEIPTWVTTGYCTLFDEIREELERTESPYPTHVFLQGGVGGLASTGLLVLKSWCPRPRFVCVEPMEADCLLTSIRSRDGSPQLATGSIQSIMSGLNCSFPSLEAWPILRAGIDLFLAIDDGYAEQALIQLYRPEGGDPRVVSGETGAAGLAGLMALMSNPSVSRELNPLDLDSHSRILLLQY